jgi:hypothetical protein
MEALSVLTPGTPRGMVVGELGSPAWSGERDGANVGGVFVRRRLP